MPGSQDPRPAGPGEALERLGRLSLRELSTDGLLQTVADLAATVLPGDPEASGCLLVRNRPTTVVSTGRLATDLDETQYASGTWPTTSCTPVSSPAAGPAGTAPLPLPA